MSEIPSLNQLSYLQFRERIPRIDQQIRVAIKTVDLLYKYMLGTARDFVASDDMQSGETRLSYIARRSERRHDQLGDHLDAYVLEKGFGTETCHAIIRQRQEARHLEELRGEYH